MSDLTVSYQPLDALLPYPQNARTHSPAQIAEIAASIRAFGFANPILVDEENAIIAGHGRALAARSLNLGQVPTIRLIGLTAAQKRALRLADNKIAANAGWDDGLLRLELGDLRIDGFDLALTGFTGLELDALFAPPNPGLTDPDEAPPAPDQPTTRLGDVWLLGRHRLVCGDATSEADVALCLAGVRPHLMVTDQPWGVEYDADWRNHRLRANGRLVGGRATGPVDDDRADWGEAWSLFPGDVGYIWHAGRRASETAIALRSKGFFLRAQIIWRKTHTIIGRGDYHYNHEPCWYVVRDGKTGHWTGRRDQGTVWDIVHDPNTTGHATQKPVECMKRPIENNSNPGQAVYDPFVGSGTTAIAAEMTGRACLALEISPAYCDVTVLRWQNFVGEPARLEVTGETFAAVMAAREADRSSTE